MATNEDLAIAFLCLAGKSEKDDILHLIKDRSKHWEDEHDNLRRLVDAIELPVAQISKKINYLHSSLLNCPFKKVVYEEMANAVAQLSMAVRSPIFKVRNEKGQYVHEPINEHILSLDTKSSTQ